MALYSPSHCPRCNHKFTDLDTLFIVVFHRVLPSDDSGYSRPIEEQRDTVCERCFKDCHRALITPVKQPPAPKWVAGIQGKKRPSQRG